MLNRKLVPILFGGQRPAVDLNFASGVLGVGGFTSSDPSQLPGWSFSRSGAGTARDLAGNVVQFATGVPRITDRGLLVETARTNLLLNSAVLATQSATVTAVAHTLSFFGTGTVTLSGVSTAGPLVGTGANNRVSLTFTPTAGSLTLTVSGDVRMGQLEVGGFRSSWIPTTGSTATRGADAPALTIAAPSAYTIFAQVNWPLASTTFGSGGLVQFDDGTNNNRAALYNAGASIGAVVASGGVNQAFLSAGGSGAADAVIKAALRVRSNDVKMASGGTLSDIDSSVIMPVAPTKFRPGATAFAGGEMDGYIARAILFPVAKTDAELQALTT